MTLDSAVNALCKWRKDWQLISYLCLEMLCSKHRQINSWCFSSC